MRGRRAAVTAAAVLLVAAAGVGAAPAPAAEDGTRCSFGGPAGTSRTLRLDLPDGSSFLNLTLSGSRVSRPAGTTSSWHLAQGVFVIDEASGRLVSYRISSDGSSTRRTVVEAGGERHADVATPGPDAPFVHSALAPVPGLAPGSYLVVAFASDGSPATPNDNWGGFVEVSGDRLCQILPSGRIFDISHNDFQGGTQVSTFGAGVIDGASLDRQLGGDLVVGFMDSSVQGPGEAELDYVMPSGSGTVDDEIVPFVSAPGAFSWAAEARGVAPIISIAGLEVDLG